MCKQRPLSDQKQNYDVNHSRLLQEATFDIAGRTDDIAAGHVMLSVHGLVHRHMNCFVLSVIHRSSRPLLQKQIHWLQADRATDDCIAEHLQSMFQLQG